MTDLYVGAGGWAYFGVPGMSPLRAYSKAFSFVEVNSTFYELPTVEAAMGWRRAVPQGFRFSVRANRGITHAAEPFSRSLESEKALERTLEVCRALGADVLHLLSPPWLVTGDGFATVAKDFFGALESGKMLVALEIRGAPSGRLPSDLVKVMADFNVIHCTDKLRGEEPAYANETMYTRGFGKGRHNLYQPDDGELESVYAAASRHSKAYVAFHGARMYSDAARLLAYERTGGFPLVTGKTGADSLARVLEEDARFPATRDVLSEDQGWKLYDAATGRRERVADALARLPERDYDGVADVISEFKKAEARSSA